MLPATSNDNRLIEIMAELLAEVHEFRQDSNKRLDQSNNRLERLEEQMTKNTMAVGELRLSVMKLADKIEDIAELDKRLRVVEAIVLRPTP